MEVLSAALVWLRGMLDSDVDYDKILKTMPGYDGERDRILEEHYMREQEQVEEPDA